MKRQKVKHFSDDEKRMIIQEYLEAGDYSQQSIMRKYGISGHSTLSRWIKKYTVGNQIIPETPEETYERQMKEEKRQRVKTPDSSPVPVRPTESEKAKDLEILRLRTELERERTMTLALNRMIDIAERTYEVPIRKKSGAKQ